MAMNVGKLNKRIRFLQIQQSSDDIGDHPVTDVFISRWANLKAVRGGEYYESQKLRAELTYKITCRWFKGLTPDMIIEYDGRRFEITDAINIDEENTWWEIHATEIIRKRVT